MEEETLNTIGYDVTPINHRCPSQKKNIINNNSADQSSINHQQIEKTSYQSYANNAADTIDAEPGPLYGGHRNQNCIIRFHKNTLQLSTNNKQNIFQFIKKNCKIKHDTLFELTMNKRKEIYLYKYTKKPSIKKIH
jgi:hypothetical protein